jgi:2-phosphosulfolactate phosphatase
MIGTLEKTVIDCPDPRSLAMFYAAVLGMQVNEDLGDWVVIGSSPGARQLAFQRAARWTPPRWPDPEHPGLHIDIRAQDIEAADRAASDLGARLVSDPPDMHFRVYLDPVGYPFCLVYGQRAAAPLPVPPTWAQQTGFAVGFDWGPPGVVATASSGAIVVVVDVLRFTTAVEAGVGAGLRIFPYRWRDVSASAFADAAGAVLADGLDPAGPSLSPTTLTRLAPGTAVVLPSPNGSTCAAIAAEAGTEIVAGCLRNATAVARWVAPQHRPVAVVAAGERWPDGSLRPAVEDLVGAGAILAALPGRVSPEARAAISAWEGVRNRVMPTLGEAASARELREKGWDADVAYALEVDVSDVVPLLRDGAFLAA